MEYGSGLRAALQLTLQACSCETACCMFASLASIAVEMTTGDECKGELKDTEKPVHARSEYEQLFKTCAKIQQF